MEVMELGANVISIDAIRENRAAGRGKNWTNAELARRTQEAEKLKSGQLKMKMPEWLKADKKERARAIWNCFPTVTARYWQPTATSAFSMRMPQCAPCRMQKI